MPNSTYTANRTNSRTAGRTADRRAAGSRVRSGASHGAPGRAGHTVGHRAARKTIPKKHTRHNRKSSTYSAQLNRIFIVAAVIFALGLLGGFFAGNSMDAGKINDLQSKIDALSSDLAQTQNTGNATESGGGGTADGGSGESGSGGSVPSDETALTPETAKKPFTKDGVVVANKKHPLPKDYDPGENAEAAENLRQLISDGKAAGISLSDTWSGYRSYAVQADLFGLSEGNGGIEQAEKYQARPGYSEHQTGLAFDLKDGTGENLYLDGKDYNYDTDWVAQNAPKYGFIVRYRDEWKASTGYAGEPWHLRYLGKDLAQRVFASGKALEDYLDISGGDYLSK